MAINSLYALQMPVIYCLKRKETGDAIDFLLSIISWYPGTPIIGLSMWCGVNLYLYMEKQTQQPEFS